MNNAHRCFVWEMLKKFVRESFFNPVIHILPIILFLIIDDFFGDLWAWKIATPVAILLSFHVYFYYRSTYYWYLISLAVYLVVGLVISFVGPFLSQSPFSLIFAEIVALFFLLVLLVFRKPISKLVTSVSSKKLSMENNFNELIRMISLFAVIFIIYITAFLIVDYNGKSDNQAVLSFIYQLHSVLLLLAVIYEFIRVFAIRGRLMKEEWLPIVNTYGKTIGCVNYQISMWNEQEKYMHPVIRVIVVENNKIFLQKHKFGSGSESHSWDNALSSHLRFGEKVTDCIQRISKELYGIQVSNPVFLGNYVIENACEYQYVHVFLSCRLDDIHPNPELVEHVKWWTLQQINEELHSGIFTDNFLKEYDILQRSGLIESGKCNCDCKLRDEILHK